MIACPLPQHAGSVNYEFDRQAADGESNSGWMTGKRNTRRPAGADYMQPVLVILFIFFIFFVIFTAVLFGAVATIGRRFANRLLNREGTTIVLVADGSHGIVVGSDRPRGKLGGDLEAVQKKAGTALVDAR